MGPFSVGPEEVQSHLGNLNLDTDNSPLNIRFSRAPCLEAEGVSRSLKKKFGRSHRYENKVTAT